MMHNKQDRQGTFISPNVMRKASHFAMLKKIMLD